MEGEPSEISNDGRPYLMLGGEQMKPEDPFPRKLRLTQEEEDERQRVVQSIAPFIIVPEEYLAYIPTQVLIESARRIEAKEKADEAPEVYRAYCEAMLSMYMAEAEWRRKEKAGAVHKPDAPRPETAN